MYSNSLALIEKLNDVYRITKLLVGIVVDSAENALVSK